MPDQKNLIFCNLFYSGSSAIVPLLEDALPGLGINVLPYGPEATQRLLDDPPAPPYFHWTHSHPEFFLPFFEQDSIRVVFLHRDPRDVAVSYIEDHVHRGVIDRAHAHEVLRDMPRTPVAEEVKAACRWVKAAETRPVKVVQFDDLKRDTVGVALDIMRFYGFEDCNEISERVRSLYDTKYSFEAMTNRERGSDGEIVRNRYMVRKGISGEWRQRFDEPIHAVWQKHLGEYIRFLGYPN